MSDVLQSRLDGRVLFLTLNRPEKRNALSLDLARELVNALNRADEDRGVGAVLLSGNGKAFCAGMDLTEIGSVDLDAAEQVHESLFTAGARLTKPVIAAVDGPALAGGTGLVANAHVVVAGAGSTFGLTEIRIGLWPLLIFRSVALAVGERQAVELSVTGRILPAAEALSMGLIHEIAEAPLQRATTIAQTVAAYSGFTLKSGLSYVREARDASWEEAGDLARRARTDMMTGGDFAEGIAAFREKRSPRWNDV